MLRLCDIVDIKSAFMEKTDLSEEEIQIIIDDIPTAYDMDEVVRRLEELPRCSTWNHNSDNIDRIKAIEIVKGCDVDAD